MTDATTGPRRRDKHRTRERISDVATSLFLAQGFDQVTVADVAAAAGVSKVTVFTHFARKEDLLLDEAPATIALVTAAIRDAPPGADPVAVLHALTRDLARERHALSGLATGAEPFLRTVTGSPVLLARAWEQYGEVERALAAALAARSDPPQGPGLLAALVLAAYRTVVGETIGQVLAGRPRDEIEADHRVRLDHAFEALAALPR